MRQVHLTINVPDKKYEQLITFLKENFGVSSVVERDGDIEIPQWQKELVLKRMQNSKNEDFFHLDSLDDKIEL